MHSEVDSLHFWIKQAALGLGFDLVGIASAHDAVLRDAGALYEAWLTQGYGASMEYLKKHRELKQHPEKLLAGCKSVVCVGLLYGDAVSQKSSTNKAQVSMYTRGHDYHHVIGEKLKALALALKQEHGIDARPFVDSEPVLERFWAWRAGLGWVGKNACLINRKQGSLFFLGGLLTTADLQVDVPQPDHCGKCRKCIDACPTHAILEPSSTQSRHVVDSRKCIAYHTIENRGPIPENIMQDTGRWIAGCDICQSVCPWNDPIVPTKNFQNSNPAFQAKLSDLARWSAAEFKEKTQDIAMGRMKYSGFLRNLAVAIANADLSDQDRESALDSLQEHMASLPNGVGRDAAVAALNWAQKD